MDAEMQSEKRDKTRKQRLCVRALLVRIVCRVAGQLDDWGALHQSCPAIPQSGTPQFFTPRKRLLDFFDEQIDFLTGENAGAVSTVERALLHRIRADVCEAAPLVANRLHRHVNQHGQNVCEHLDLGRRRKLITFLLKSTRHVYANAPGLSRGGASSSFEVRVRVSSRFFLALRTASTDCRGCRLAKAVNDFIDAVCSSTDGGWMLTEPQLQVG